jgi:excisionase family DNA binding protein
MAQTIEETRGPTMTVDEAAALLGISRGLAFEAVKRGELPHLRIGKRILIVRSRLEALLEGDTNAPEQTAA